MSNRKMAGVMISEVPFINLPVLLKQCGLDYLLIDAEHGGFDYNILSGMIMNARLSGIQAIVRIPDNQRRDINRLMDMGVDGLLLPMTNSAYDIEQVVRYAKYTPIGQRGISTTRAHTYYNPPALETYMEEANRRTKVFAQIETKAGMEHIEEILAVKGVYGVMIGPNDLSCDLNCIGDEAPILDAIRKVGSMVQKSGKEGGIITSVMSYLKCAAQYGLNWYCVGSELNMLKNGAKNVLEKINGL